MIDADYEARRPKKRGAVPEELTALGIDDDTVVLFTADHGEMLGDHGLSQKNSPYEPSVRVPLLLRWPLRTRPGTTCDDPVGLTTCCRPCWRNCGSPTRRRMARCRDRACSAHRAADWPQDAATT